MLRSKARQIHPLIEKKKQLDQEENKRKNDLIFQKNYRKEKYLSEYEKAKQ